MAVSPYPWGNQSFSIGNEVFLLASMLIQQLAPSLEAFHYM
jgi:hypothetical protein